MKIKNKIGILHLTDIHFGHSKVSTSHIAGNIIAMILDNEKEISKNIDILFLGGDEFEDLLTADSDDFKIAIEFFIFISKFCVKNNIKIRCIEGTNSHSYKQMKTMEAVIISEPNIDFKYIDTLDIEYIPDLDINVLYVPDELNGNNSEVTTKQIKKLLFSKKIEKVDVAVTHGFFLYHLPMVKSKAAHIESEFLSFTKHFIYNGHIHTHSVYDRIITTGGPDRTKHGEEEDKGMIFSIIDTKDSSKDMYRFIVNKNAKIFKTIKVETDSLIELKEILKKELRYIPKESYIRLHVANENNLIKNNLLELKKTFKHYIFTEEKISKSKISIMDNKLLEKKTIETINIDRNNIIPLIMDRVGDKVIGNDIMELEKELKLLL